ncbi:DNA replication/repair protein RecF [Haloferula rosea]|uniref:DNA replication and repair protein RecF n=1 Tax=Haloferula rosea TaxID=490093 RepID=A0A934RBI6_9BACT|nr:DNA replication and repair protein RecF [Haloferula rosea]MBK1825956.1 DNA replication and repair protein RecF [Haloferula rosea]
MRAVDFRCFSALSVEVPAAGALLTGQNAQGKTSVLEAVCLLVRLHSPRSHRMATMARVGGAGGFGVAGEAWNSERRMKWEPRRPVSYQVDGEERSSQNAYLSDGGLLVWMGNEDVDLIRAGGEGRRRYLDFIGSQIDMDYRRALHRYRRALKAKNFLLKEGSLREAEIQSYEGVMIESAAVIQPVRERIMKALSPAVAEYQTRIAGRDELLELDYQPAGGGHFPEALEQARDRERRQRRSLVGPHRDDVVIRINGLDASDFASEGQQRTAALALKLAQGQVLSAGRGEQPIWLIDDVFGELDVMRRNALMEALPQGAQKWITTTHLDWLDQASPLGELARFTVREGTLES